MNGSNSLIAGPADWDSLRSSFEWPSPDRFNIAHEVCDKWAEASPERVALIHPRDNLPAKHYSFGELSRLSGKLSSVLENSGFGKGDRLAVLLPQVPETVLAHLATSKRGGIVVPLFTLFGEDGLRFRLQNSGAKVIVTDSANLPKILNIAADLPDLEDVFCIDGSTGARDFWGALLAHRTDTVVASTKLETPALLVYTSGTTGPPKGALHGHQVLLGHLPGVETHHEFFPQDGDLMWTPADWAWMGGLMDALLPSLYHGVPVLTHRLARFNAREAYALMIEYGVRNAFLPPTALKMLKQEPVPEGLSLRSVGSGGEALGADLLTWGEEALGLTINEFYGSTECNLVLGNCASVMAPRPGSTGRAVPGKDVAVLDADGAVLPAGEVGEIAVKRGDPAMFLEYWGQPEKTASKFSGDWLRMGDEGYVDADGFFFFSSRTDDVITSSGYRIGPGEIEECLTGHPDVAMAGAIGVPDPERGEVVKAFVVMSKGASFAGLEDLLIARVRERISPHVAPRSIVEIAELPMTATGKIMRRDLREL